MPNLLVTVVRESRLGRIGARFAYLCVPFATCIVVRAVTGYVPGRTLIIATGLVFFIGAFVSATLLAIASFQSAARFGTSEEERTTSLGSDTSRRQPGHNFVVDADIQGYFDGIDRSILMDLVKERISDRRVLKLIRQWLEAAGLRRIGLVMNRLGLKLHPEKTRMVDLRRGQESFEFLGCTIRKKRSIQRNPRMYFMQRWPSPRAMKRIQARVHELTAARHSGQDVKQIIATLNPVLRGWGNCFRTGNAERKFNQPDSYVYYRLAQWMSRRGGQRRRGMEKWTVSSVWACISCAEP